MPWASLMGLHVYGPGAAASTTSASASASLAGLSGVARAEGQTAGVASVPLAKPTRLVNQPCVVNAGASSPQALPKGRVRAGALVRVNTLGQDDVTGAVLEAEIEPGLTLRQALRLLAAVGLGKTTITPGVGDTATVVFRDVNDTKPRVTASMDGSERLTVATDAS